MAIFSSRLLNKLSKNSDYAYLLRNDYYDNVSAKDARLLDRVSFSPYVMGVDYATEIMEEQDGAYTVQIEYQYPVDRMMVNMDLRL